MTAVGVASAQTKKLMKFSLSLFCRGFNSSKCKTAAKMAVARIKLLKNKRQVVVKQMRRDIAVLLQSGQDATARIRVEHVIREEKIQSANEIIELFCELIVARLNIITKQKECPVDLKEGIASLIFAAPRCSEIPELGDLRDIFEKKYGRDFVSAATDLRPTCGVNQMLIDKLSVRRPGGEFKLKIMKEIAKEFQLDWDANETEHEEESIDGPRSFVSASTLPVNHTAQEPIDLTKAVPRRSSSRTSINTHYHDSESAAKASTELAKQAVVAAQAASLLATRRDTTKEFSVSSSFFEKATNQKDSQYMDHHHHHPGSRKQSRDSETSSYDAKPSVENRGIYRRHSYNNPSINESAHEEEDYTKTEADAKETRRHSYNSPSLSPAASEIKFDESDYYEEESEPKNPLQSCAFTLPPNRAPPQGPQSADSRRDSSGHQVHPKLPDYDILAARFEAIRHSKGPLI